MSRASQFFWYLTADKMPTETEEELHYTAIKITPAVKEARRVFRRRQKENGSQCVMEL